MITQEKPKILVNINNNESILLTSPKKVNSIIENISNFIFNNNSVLPSYNTDVKKKIYNQKEGNFNQKEENFNQKEENFNQKEGNFNQKEEIIKKPKEKIESLQEILLKSDNNVLFLKWDIEAQQYTFK